MLPPGWCFGKLLPDLDMVSVVFMSFGVFARGGGGGIYQPVVGGGGGGLLHVLVFLRWPPCEGPLQLS